MILGYAELLLLIFFRTHCANFMIELPNAYAARKDELHLEFAMSRCTVGKSEPF